MTYHRQCFGIYLIQISNKLRNVVSDIGNGLTGKKFYALCETPALYLPMHTRAFRWQMNQDAMATEKLAEGIRLFAKDSEALYARIKEDAKL